MTWNGYVRIGRQNQRRASALYLTKDPMSFLCSLLHIFSRPLNFHAFKKESLTKIPFARASGGFESASRSGLVFTHDFPGRVGIRFPLIPVLDETWTSFSFALSILLISDVFKVLNALRNLHEIWKPIEGFYLDTSSVRILSVKDSMTFVLAAYSEIGVTYFNRGTLLSKHSS